MAKWRWREFAKNICAILLLWIATACTYALDTRDIGVTSDVADALDISRNTQHTTASKVLHFDTSALECCWTYPVLAQFTNAGCAPLGCAVLFYPYAHANSEWNRNKGGGWWQ